MNNLPVLKTETLKKWRLATLIILSAFSLAGLSGCSAISPMPVIVPETPTMPPPVRPDTLNLKPIEWQTTGVACLGEQSYKSFEWLLLEFTRWKTMANERLDYYEAK